MTYATDSARPDRRPITVVQIEFDNLIASDPLYICDCIPPLGQDMWQCVTGVSFSPTKITGDGLGYRANVTISIEDFPHSSGTFFGRHLGANPYFLDRPIRVYQGFLHEPFSLSNLKERLYFIKKIDGPDEKGRVKITGSDVLSLLDGDRALWPPASYGNLASSLTSSATGSINIGDNTNITAGTYVMIDSEICSVSVVTGGTNITLSGRGRFGTEAVAHDADAPVRRVGHSIDVNVVDRIYSLIDQGTSIDVSTYINLTDWNAQRDTYLATDDVTGVITEPTPVKDILKDLCRQFQIALWWDDEEQLIKLKAIGPTLATATKINTTDHILDGGHAVKRDQSKAITQVWVYYDKIDASKGNQPENFRSYYVHIDTDLESASGYGAAKIERVFADQIPDSGTSTVSKIAQRIVARMREGQVEISFALDVRDASIAVGDTIEITTDLIQDAAGNPAPKYVMVIERNRKESLVEYVAVPTGVEVGSRYGYVGPDTLPNYTSATTAQRARYVWIASASTGELSNGDSAYLMI